MGAITTIRIVPWGRMILFTMVMLAALIMLLNAGILTMERLSDPAYGFKLKSLATEEYLIGAGLAAWAILILISIRRIWARLVVTAGNLHYKRPLAFGESERIWPVTSAQGLVIDRMRFGKMRGSVSDGFLIIVSDGKKFQITLGDPMLIGSGVLRAARKLSLVLNLPVQDDRHADLCHGRFFIDRWKSRGEEWKILVLIFGLAILMVVAGGLYKRWF